MPTTIDVPHTRDEIAALVETMNALLEKVQASIERERDFVADASHELRTPFAVLRGELELAQRPGKSRDELLDAIHRAADEAERLTTLADDLLLLTRQRPGPPPAPPGGGRPGAAVAPVR